MHDLLLSVSPLAAACLLLGLFVWGAWLSLAPLINRWLSQGRPLPRPWKARLYLALLTWSSLWAVCGCGTAPLQANPLPPVPARLMTPPHPPVLLEPVDDSQTSGATTTSTPASAPKTAASSPS